MTRVWGYPPTDGWRPPMRYTATGCVRSTRPRATLISWLRAIRTRPVGPPNLRRSGGDATPRSPTATRSRRPRLANHRRQSPSTGQDAQTAFARSTAGSWRPGDIKQFGVPAAACAGQVRDVVGEWSSNSAITAIIVAPLPVNGQGPPSRPTDGTGTANLADGRIAEQRRGSASKSARGRATTALQVCWLRTV